MTDNGSCYRSSAFRKACTQLGLKHLFTQPYTPRPTAKTNALSIPLCASGPTPDPIKTPTNAPRHCLCGCKDTTGTDRTVPCNANHPVSRLHLEDNALTTHS